MKCQHELRRRTGQRTVTSQWKISKDHSYFFLKQPRQSHGATSSGTPRANSSVARPERIPTAGDISISLHPSLPRSPWHRHIFAVSGPHSCGQDSGMPSLCLEPTTRLYCPTTPEFDSNSLEAGTCDIRGMTTHRGSPPLWWY
jgi:hypothetical protein